MVMEFGVGDFQVMDFRRRAILLFDHGTDLAAGLCPGLHVCHFPPEKLGFHAQDVRTARAVRSSVNTEPVHRGGTASNKIDQPAELAGAGGLRWSIERSVWHLANDLGG